MDPKPNFKRHATRNLVDGYHFEWQVDSREAVKRVGNRICLVGNINNARTLLQGTPEDVYQPTRYPIEAGVNIIGPECVIPPLSTPVEKMRAIRGGDPGGILKKLAEKDLNPPGFPFSILRRYDGRWANKADGR